MVLVSVTRDPALADNLKVRRALDLLGYDPPADAKQVLLKPNFIRQSHLLREEHRQVITQHDVIGPVADWVAGWPGASELVLADAPDGGADMDLILERSGARRALATASAATDRPWRLEDLRLTRFDERDGVPVARIEQVGDSHGSSRVNLGRRSAFYGHDATHRYYGADYDIDETNRHHSGDIQEYMFSRTALESDVILNLPKMKTHKKSGVTLSLKNLVGLNTNKNWLPHFSMGTPRTGGDAYPDDSAASRLESQLLTWLKPKVRDSRRLSEAMRIARRCGLHIFGDTNEVVRSGNWRGNDTIWRMILDLNRVLLYAKADGTVANTPQRHTLSIVDGIVAGEGNGPMAPDPVDAGIIVAGESFAAVDLVCTKLMGIDWHGIPHLAHLFDPHELPLAPYSYEEIEVVSDYAAWARPLAEIPVHECLRFRPHFAWAGHVELAR